jgi:hypothetical protein
MITDSESAGLRELAAEFPDYDFGMQRTWDGTSIIAVRQDGSERPGLCVVITADIDEMRRALLDGECQGALPEPRVGSLGEDRG